MLSLEQLQQHFSHLPAGEMDIVIELRNLVAQAAPFAAETVQRSGLIYFHAQRGGHVSAGICQILVRPGQVRLAFNHGAFLPDPAGLLRAEGRAYKRFVPIAAFDEAPWEDLRALIQAAARFDPRTAASRTSPQPDGS